VFQVTNFCHSVNLHPFQIVQRNVWAKLQKFQCMYQGCVMLCSYSQSLWYR